MNYYDKVLGPALNRKIDKSMRKSQQSTRIKS